MLPGVFPLLFDEFTIFELTDDTLKMSDNNPSLYPDDDVPEKRAATFRRLH